MGVQLMDVQSMGAQLWVVQYQERDNTGVGHGVGDGKDGGGGIIVCGHIIEVVGGEYFW